MAMKTERRFVGEVIVEHGGVAILDHLYTVISDEDEERILGAGVDGARLDCLIDFEQGSDPADTDAPSDEPERPDWVDHVGVWVPTGLGDGRYPVYADVAQIPGAGARVARIVIDCLGTEAESEMLRADTLNATKDLREQTKGTFDVKLPYDPARGIDDEIRRRALGEDGE
jgi:hypothetical protein